MSPLHCNARRVARSIGLAAALLGLTATSALAAPAFEVTLTRDEPVVSRSDERVDYTATVTNIGPDPTSGEVTLTVELPGGQETFVFNTSGSGWTCEKLPASGVEPAKAVCKRSDVLSSTVSFSALTVVAALGVDAPETAQASAEALGGGAATASAINEFIFEPLREFGITAFETTVPDETGIEETRAGAHPFSAGAIFAFPRYRRLNPENALAKYGAIEHGKTILTDTPRGFVGNALAVPELCSGLVEVLANTCPAGSTVGGISVELTGFGPLVRPIYSIVPEFGLPAQFAFMVPAAAEASPTYTFAPYLRPEDGYAITLESAPAPRNPELLGLPDVTLCSFGAKLSGGTFAGCKKAGEPDANPIPLITLPTRCEGQPPTTVAKVNSWENPGVFKSKAFSAPPVTECDGPLFEPVMNLIPTSKQADSPTGMDIEITMPTTGLETPTGISQANLKGVEVTFPAGMAINASAGDGLGSCSAAEVGIDPSTGVPNDQEAHCPDPSKIGTISIATPLIEEKLTGDVFIAKQGKDNPFGSNVALYVVFSSKRDGITIKLAGEVAPDPKTGQLTVSFADNPEAPFSSVEMHFPQGSRSSLITPPKCGTYEIKAALTPWNADDPDNPTAAETVIQTSSFEVTEGPNGGPCPDGKLNPKLSIGTTTPEAGKQSPFVMSLRRDDGTERFAALDLPTPPGLTADLKGVPYCPDEVLRAISPAPETGQAQIDNPSCPAASQIGTARAGAGAGPDPLYVDTGKAYLAGPYKGAPLSLALVTPAVAGPLDLGNVVVRTALYVDAKTARITAISDPIPTILHGILLDIRDIRVSIDRPNFVLNPTNCEPMSIDATVTGESGAKAGASSYFQVENCAALGFKPSISLSLKGGTDRGDNPALKAVVRPRPGDANIARASVTLPRSAFLDQAHIRTICTRVQFAADNCPKAAIYGRAEAITPLLDHPLVGPVYLRSSDNELPDLVADLRGPEHQPIKVEAAFRTDSIKGGIRSTLDLAPDAPVTKFTLQMQGGKKGLVVNSQDLCSGIKKATVRLNAQNGRRHNFRPKVVATNCGKQGKARAGRRN